MQGFVNAGNNEGVDNEDQNDASEPDQGAEESDSSEDEVQCFFLLFSFGCGVTNLI